MLAKIAPYNKFVIALAGAVALAAEAIADGQVGETEVGGVATALVAAYFIFKKANAPLPAPPA